MSSEVDIFSALKFVCGNSKKVCRLCFASTENEEVSLYDSARVQKSFVDEVVTFAAMFKVLNVQIEPLLPQVLCMDCANTVINTYLFNKLRQYSNDKWNKVLHRFQESLTQPEKINVNRKTAYIVINEKENIIVTSRTAVPNKTAAIGKIKRILYNKTRNVKKKKQPVECYECKAPFTCKTSLERHVKSHNKDAHNIRIPCPNCDKYFRTQMSLKEHKERVHYPKTIQCTQCEKMFATERILKQHEKNNHIAAVCQLCFVQLPSKNALSLHLDKHEMNKCEQCNKTFTTRNRHRLHLKKCGRADSKDPKFFCDICDKGYVLKKSLCTHLKTSHGFGHALTCNWCMKKFDVISRLKDHIVTHTKERNFCCALCGGQFVTQAALLYHTRLHTGEKPFPCDMCGERFLSASRRMEHKRRKHWAPTEQCIYCNVKFVTKHSLKRHVARHTNPKSKLYIPLE